MRYEPLLASNGRILTPTLWGGENIPQGWAPLDGRTIGGVSLPDRRDRFLYRTPDKVDPMAKTVPAILSICEIVRIEDVL